MTINKLIGKYTSEEIADSFVIATKIKQLKKVLAINSLKEVRKKTQSEISIDETELSQLINKHRQLIESIIIRLELHSNNTIPAVLWYKLLEKEKVHSLQINIVLRKMERKNVNNLVELNLV